MRVTDATLAEVRERGFSLVEGFLGRRRGRGGPRCALAPLPETRGLFREPRRARALRGEPVRRRRGVPVPLVGPQPSRRPPGSGGHGRALPPDRRAASLQGGAVGQVRRCRQLRPAAPPRLWQSQPGRPPSRGPLPTTHDLHLLVRRDRAGWPHPHRALRRGQGRPLSRRCTSPSDRWPSSRCRCTGPAGTLLVYRTDILHRGSDFTAPGRSRFSILADFQARGTTWGGKMAWPKQSPERWARFMPQCSVRERDLFGFPRPGDPYWTEETLEGVAARYPGIDLGPYRVGEPS